MKVIKKDGTIEQFDGQKIVNAVSKSAARAMIELDDTQSVSYTHLTLPTN